MNKLHTIMDVQLKLLKYDHVAIREFLQMLIPVYHLDEDSPSRQSFIKHLNAYNMVLYEVNLIQFFFTKIISMAFS